MAQNKPDNAHEQVAQILAHHIDAPQSQSAAWINTRADTIGGSEVATLLGLNPYRKRIDFIADKCGFNESFVGNPATRWGSVMERATEKFTHNVLKMNTPIYALGSLPTVINGQRYTPDGLGVVTLRNMHDIIKEFIAVFEFKSPARSVPDGKIPKHYAPQLQTGLLAIPEAHIGIFTNCAFRKCKLADFNFELTYDRVYHNGDSRKFTVKQSIREVFAIGKVYFTASQAERDAYAAGKYAEEPEDVFIYNSEIVDVGAASPRLTDRIFELVTCQRLTAYHSDIILNAQVVNQMEITQTHKIIHSQNTIENLPENLEHFKVAVMSWKIVRADIITMDRISNWREVIEPVVLSTLSDIRAIRESADPYIEFQKKFGQQVDDFQIGICGADNGDVSI